LLVADGIALGLWGPGAFRLATDPNFANREFGGVLAAGLVTGLLLSTVGTPLIHAPHHHGGRTIGSMAGSKPSTRSMRATSGSSSLRSQAGAASPSPGGSRRRNAHRRHCGTARRGL
jgi:hypothetical protein